MKIRYEHLLGLHFEHGKQDCYSIIRQFYADNFGIHLTDYVRPDQWWNTPGLNFYMDLHEREGFRVVDVRPRDYQIGDLLLVAIHAEVPHHAGIFIGGQKPILHHYSNRLSEVTHLSAMWRNCLTAVIRHKDVPKIEEDVEVINAIDLLAPKFKARIREEAPELLSE